VQTFRTNRFPIRQSNLSAFRGFLWLLWVQVITSQGVTFPLNDTSCNQQSPFPPLVLMFIMNNSTTVAFAMVAGFYVVKMTGSPFIVAIVLLLTWA
jgi:hypothetical protein